MSEPALKCENNDIFTLKLYIFTLKLLIGFKMAFPCCFSVEENLDFPKFLKKCF